MSLLKLRRSGAKEASNLEKLAIPVLDKSLLGISDAAADRIKYLLSESATPDAYLRVAIKGGGCSGMTIHYEFCDNLRHNDIVFEHKNIRICVDPKSLGFLGGATLHFQESHGVREFVLVNNPSEKQCSCGKSFAL
jgi:iron-sulfur cluster assembly accessory protein